MTYISAVEKHKKKQKKESKVNWNKNALDYVDGLFTKPTEEFASQYGIGTPIKEKDTLTVTSKEGNVINVDWKPKGRA